jgi:hypothetical protein
LRALGAEAGVTSFNQSYYPHSKLTAVICGPEADDRRGVEEWICRGSIRTAPCQRGLGGVDSGAKERSEHHVLAADDVELRRLRTARRRLSIPRYAFTLWAGTSGQADAGDLPFVMLLLDWWPLGRFSVNSITKPGKSATGGNRAAAGLYLICEKVPFFALSAVSSYISYLSVRQLGIMISTELVPIKIRILNSFVSYVGYIGKIIFPRGLAVFYPYSEDIPAWQSIGALALLLCVTIVLLLGFRRRPFLQ